MTPLFGTPQVYKVGYMRPDLVQQGLPYVALLKDVLVETGFGAVFEDRTSRLYINETSGRNPANHPYLCGPHSLDRRFFPMCCPAPDFTLDAPLVLLGTDGGNYSHWLSRNVMKLYLLEGAAVPHDLPLLVNEDLRNYQLEFLELLGIPRGRLLPVPPGLIRCREVYVPTNLRNHPHMRRAIEWLRARLAHLLAPPASARDLLFVSRRDSRERVLLNEAELEEQLLPLGFRTVALGELTVREQIAAFSRARVIVAAHGSGLTNLMFAPPGAAVLEITNTKIHRMNDFRLIASQMGQTHAEVVSDSYPPNQRTEVLDEIQRHDFFVDIPTVMNRLQPLLERQYP